MERLPRDVLCRILDQLPIESVASFRCANKEFYGDPVIGSRVRKFIEEPRLVLLHNFPLRNGRYATPRFELDADANIFRASTPDAKPYHTYTPFLGSCNGLMCFYGDNRGHLLLVNPFLKEVLPVSTSCLRLDSEDWNPIPKGCPAGFGLDHVSGSYKFVAILYKERTALVYNFSTRQWRVISPPSATPKYIRGTFIGGILYWLPEDRYKGQMISFDVAKEEFSSLPCPSSAYVLFDLENRLGIGCSDKEGNIHILELNNCSKEWTKRYKIDSEVLLPLGYKGGEYSVTDFAILGLWNQRIAILGGAFCSYDPQSRKAKYIYEFPGEPVCCIRGSVVSLSRFNS